MQVTQTTEINSLFCFKRSDTAGDKLSVCVNRMMLLSFSSFSDALTLGQTCKTLQKSVRKALPQVLNQMAINLRVGTSKILKNTESTEAALRQQIEKLLVNFLEELETTPGLYIKLHEFLANKNKTSSMFDPLVKALKEIEESVQGPCEGYINLTNLKLRSLFFHFSCGIEHSPNRRVIASSVVRNWLDSLPEIGALSLNGARTLLMMEHIYDQGVRSTYDINEEMFDPQQQISALKLMPGVQRIKVTRYFSQNHFNRLKETGKIIDARKTHCFSLKNIDFSLRGDLFIVWGISALVGIISLPILLKTFDLLLLPTSLPAFLLSLIWNPLGVAFYLLVSLPINGFLIALTIVAIADKIFCTFFRYHKPAQTQLIKA